ncbi:hypothetical protein C0Q70_13365 [Pomacea canaliculata]|uniref:Cytochrome P450 n=1 Tax=Pomacea canaliculata TaxID=400727 RepID=A0A2T7NX14_POMCA|nr:hypothetical protein C0Q70_13365 [Pomacea canaliculata]
MRHTMTPTFSTSKLKLMGPYINRCCDNLSSALQRLSEKRELADVKSTVSVPPPDFQLLQISETPSESLFTVYRMIDQLIEDRKKNGANERVDLLQLLLEAEASEADIAAKPRTDVKLTRVEIIAQGMVIFIAGYETTATTLQYMSYLLALNPNKQEKLYNEIIAAIGDAPPTYENVMNIKYLDNVLWETLRYFPPVPMIGRRAAEARTIKGVHIEAGSCIGVPVFAFMHDEEIFSDPEKFIPERFDDEDMPTLVRELAFGAGPRQCIGMRLALYEAKMAAVTIIRRFRFIKVPETPMTITFRKSTLSSPDKPILLEVEPRKGEGADKEIKLLTEGMLKNGVHGSCLIYTKSAEAQSECQRCQRSIQGGCVVYALAGPRCVGWEGTRQVQQTVYIDTECGYSHGSLPRNKELQNGDGGLDPTRCPGCADSVTTVSSNVPRRTAPYPLNLSVVFTMGDNWRRIRHTMTPTFSTGRLKLMGRYISRCCDNLSSAFQRLTEKQELADVKRIFGAYTIDVIAGTAFGLETDSLVRENNPFLKAIVKMFQKSKTLGWRSAFLTLFPFLSPVLLLLRLSDAPTEEVNNVVRLIDQLIDDRRKNGDNERVDLLHLLLEAEASEADIAAKPQDRQLTRVEIIAQSMLIFIAGYETTATTLHYMTYLLALNPNKQEKLYNEIIAAIGDAPPTYENVMNIKYLDNVIRETLRSFPPVPLIGRRAVEARTIKGVHIEAGSCIGVPLYAFTHDEETFSDPDKFIPERFDDKDMPTVISELAFGMGPRQCIGMRLALYEAKMAAVTIIRRFRFIKVPETPMMITFRRSTLSSPEKPILLGVEPRNRIAPVYMRTGLNPRVLFNLQYTLCTQSIPVSTPKLQHKKHRAPPSRDQ